MVGDRDAITDPERRDPVADAGDFAHQLVSEHGACGRTAGFELEQIGSAKPRDAQPEQQLARLRGRQGAFLHVGAIAAAADDDPVTAWN